MVARSREEAIDLLVKLHVETHKKWWCNDKDPWNTGLWHGFSYDVTDHGAHEVREELEEAKVLVQEVSVGSGVYCGGGS